jgi:hypothetical protein
MDGYAMFAPTSRKGGGFAAGSRGTKMAICRGGAAVAFSDDRDDIRRIAVGSAA